MAPRTASSTRRVGTATIARSTWSLYPSGHAGQGIPGRLIGTRVPLKPLTPAKKSWQPSIPKVRYDACLSPLPLGLSDVSAKHSLSHRMDSWRFFLDSPERL